MNHFLSGQGTKTAAILAHKADRRQPVSARRLIDTTCRLILREKATSKCETRSLRNCPKNLIGRICGGTSRSRKVNLCSEHSATSKKKASFRPQAGARGEGAALD